MVKKNEIKFGFIPKDVIKIQLVKEPTIQFIPAPKSLTRILIEFLLSTGVTLSGVFLAGLFFGLGWECAKRLMGL